MMNYVTFGDSYVSHKQSCSSENDQMKKSINYKQTFQTVSSTDCTSPSMFINFLSHISYAVMTLFGFLRDFMRRNGLERTCGAMEKNDMKDFVPLYSSFESFYTRNIYIRMRDCMSRPITSVPGATLDVAERIYGNSGWTIKLTENTGYCCDCDVNAIKSYGVGVCSTRLELGNFIVHEQLEQVVASYLGVEDCLSFGMGFATNSTNIPSLIDEGCLIFSDQLNHASIVLGCRLSGATICVFKHNDMIDLELKLKKAIVDGQPRKHYPWKKILIIVEGIYSMEGTIVNLPALMTLKKKYNIYLYLDEAHSIGALGKTGRGVTEHFGVNPKNVDLLMGTFTKSFGAAGGYIAGAKVVIDHIRRHSHSSCYATSMAPVVAAQIIASIQKLNDRTDGHKRISRLSKNSRMFREGLKQKGFIVAGHDDSPIVPMMVFMPAKLSPFSREMLERGIAVVVAGFPAVPLNESRVRFCISAAHTEDQICQALETINEVGDIMGLKYLK